MAAGPPKAAPATEAPTNGHRAVHTGTRLITGRLVSISSFFWWMLLSAQYLGHTEQSLCGLGCRRITRHKPHEAHPNANTNRHLSPRAPLTLWEAPIDAKQCSQ